jgi:acylaminoacyl-peptidase
MPYHAHSLPGRIGEQDVSDVYEATKRVVEEKEVDGMRVGVCGGSHGGFLGAHMIGQHPELFRAAALRNPVVSIHSMAHVTDIPDWCAVEALGIEGSYDFNTYSPPSKEAVEHMYKASPISHVDRSVRHQQLRSRLDDLVSHLHPVVSSPPGSKHRR